MYAMQYEITLPADYDMGIIRRRVAARGHLTDNFGGLGLKAFLIRERGTDTAPVNQYAPFYLWRDISGMNRFLWGGGGFQGIVDDFGRPTVQTWTGVACHTGPASGATGFAIKDVVQLAPGEHLAELIEHRMSDLEELASTPGVHTAALAADPRTWELATFTLWERGANPPVRGTRYLVLHLSAPHLADIAAGRAW